MNHMKQVICPRISGVFWANSCKTKKTEGGVRSEYRCCKCGDTGHAVVR